MNNYYFAFRELNGYFITNFYYSSCLLSNNLKMIIFSVQNFESSYVHLLENMYYQRFMWNKKTPSEQPLKKIYFLKNIYKK